MPSEVTKILCAMLCARDATGLKKYGVSLDRPDLTVEQWLDHLTEEMLDGAGYAQSTKREIQLLRTQVNRLQATVERQRRVLESLLEWASPDAVLRFDSGDISVSDFIAAALNPPKPNASQSSQ